MKKRIISAVTLALAFSVTLSGCVAENLAAVENAEPIKVFKYEGSKQCEPGSGVSLETMQQALAKAGVNVICAHRGHDGRMRIQMCGADTGKMNLFVIPGDQLQQAKALGFSAVSELKGYIDSECK